MENLPVIVKEVLVSSDLHKIKKLNLKKISIDSLIGAINCIPVVGGAIASYLQIIKSSRESYLEMEFYRKLLALLYEVKDLQPKDIEKFMDEVECKAKDSSGNVIANLINRSDNINKASVLANLIKSKINNNISIHDFFRLTSMLERIPYIDLNELEKYKKAYYDESGDTELLYATGALKLDTIDAQYENLYVLSELGRKLLEFGMKRSATDIENRGGTSVSGMITAENAISDRDIDHMLDDQAVFEFDRYRGK